MADEIKKPAVKGKKLMARIDEEATQARTIMAFGGKEYVRKEWRPVPNNKQDMDQARNHPYLEVK